MLKAIQSPVLMRLFSTPTNNAPATLFALLRALSVRATRTTTSDLLTHHPDYPSLAAMSATLNALHVENMAVRLMADQLTEVPTPFVAHLTTNGGLFALVQTTERGIVQWWHTANGWQHQPIADFATNWSGTVLMAEASPMSGETDYLARRQQEWLKQARLPFLWSGLLTVAVAALWLLWQQTPLPTVPVLWALLLTKTVGTAVCGLLLAYTINQDNALLRWQNG
jgi:ABC-type bacteriocin/lantibiotic exporter with double-glycine peptidase domain